MFPIIAIYLMSMPASFLAGKVWAHRNRMDTDYVPWVCAAIPPMGAVLAIVVLTQTEVHEKEFEDDET